MKIYTKTGDKGTTSLVGGVRVAKNHVRLDAYGTLDELNAHLGVLQTYVTEESDKADVVWIQGMLLVAGTLLATEADSPLLPSLPKVREADVERLESAIDTIQTELPPLKAFVLPGGSRGSAVCHVCRTVCRRAERRVLDMVAEGVSVDALILSFLNRLSDYLFVLSRKMNRLAGNTDFFWNNACD